MADAPLTVRVPWWARLLDSISIAAALIAITVFVTGGFREWTPLGRISMTSWARPLTISLISLVLRHVLRPRPILPLEVFYSVRRWWSVSEARSVWPVVVATRFGVLVVGFLAIVLISSRWEKRA